MLSIFLGGIALAAFITRSRVSGFVDAGVLGVVGVCGRLAAIVLSMLFFVLSMLFFVLSVYNENERQKLDFATSQLLQNVACKFYLNGE